MLGGRRVRPMLPGDLGGLALVIIVSSVFMILGSYLIINEESDRLIGGLFVCMGFLALILGISTFLGMGPNSYY